MYKYVWHCRWCGITYAPDKRTYRDGFCCPRHKQALHRAYKKYVTAAARQNTRLQACRVTPKKRKKRR